MKAYEEARDSEAEQGGSVRPMRGAVKPLFVSGYAGSKQNALQAMLRLRGRLNVCCAVDCAARALSIPIRLVFTAVTSPCLDSIPVARIVRFRRYHHADLRIDPLSAKALPSCQGSCFR